MTTILAIETSCDETAVAVVVDGRKVRSSIVSSQIDLHAKYGGVVPEVAGRAHVDALTPVVEEAMERAAVTPAGLDAVAATIGPGLIGSLLVGVSAAKAYSLAWGVPFVGVNHMEGHLHAAFLEEPNLALPAAVLLVSGGHTLLIGMEKTGHYRLLGQTIDDDAGEAYDKVARFLGLGYPGGPAIDRVAKEGDPQAVDFPRGLTGKGNDFSFSGVKTAVVRYVRANPEVPVADVAASFQCAVVEVLVEKLRGAAEAIGAKSLCIGGGVAANSLLRERVKEAAVADGRLAFLPSRAMCTDNAAMVGATAWYRLEVDGPTSLAVPADPNLRLDFVPG